MYEWKSFNLLTLVSMERLLQRDRERETETETETDRQRDRQSSYSEPFFSRHNVSARMKFVNFANCYVFSKSKLHAKHKIKIWLQIFGIFARNISLICESKSRRNIGNLHSRKLVQAKILWRKCKAEVKKLVYNTMWNIVLMWRMFYYLLTLNPRHHTKKGTQTITLSNDVLQYLSIWQICILGQVITINSITRKIFLKDWNEFFSSKKDLASKENPVILQKTILLALQKAL